MFYLSAIPLSDESRIFFLMTFLHLCVSDRAAGSRHSWQAEGDSQVHRKWWDHRGRVQYCKHWSVHLSSIPHLIRVLQRDFHGVVLRYSSWLVLFGILNWSHKNTFKKLMWLKKFENFILSLMFILTAFSWRSVQQNWGYYLPPKLLASLAITILWQLSQINAVPSCFLSAQQYLFV